MGEENKIDSDGFLRALEEVLQLPSDTFTGGEVLRELPCWDSLAIVEFMAFADERYSITMDPKQITSCATIHDLFLALQTAANEL